MSRLPPGQSARSDFPRFGLPRYAARSPRSPLSRTLSVSRGEAPAIQLIEPLGGLARIQLQSDFHCVTTWSSLNLSWSGVRFVDLYEAKIAPQLDANATATHAVIRGQDGYRTTLPLKDLLASDVILADQLGDEPLSIAHGAPWRLVAPRHYGYKSVKHLSRIELWSTEPDVRPAAFRFMDHPRARVSQEERGRWVPGWLLRYLYRPLVAGTIRRFASEPRA
ncbi:MAG TPA: molybdopterin-dependent oxidoreductase [Polyangiaceae bacterium]|nr:molybdopterin-dependent oxidoreductase [Polyangiaceae bacterium]